MKENNFPDWFGEAIWWVVVLFVIFIYFLIGYE
jgi:hypothetical protein